MADQTFPKQFRLLTSRDFQRVFERKTSVADDLTIMYGCQNDLPYTRVGLSVSRKVGGAVVRNRWKRVLREAFRISRLDWPQGMDVVIIPRREAEPEFHRLVVSLPKLARRLQRRLQHSPRLTKSQGNGSPRR